MQIQKAVVTAASPEDHSLPLQRLVDRDGRTKTVLQMVIDEVTAAGVQQVGVVIRPSDRDAYSNAAEETSAEVTLLVQHEPQGYGDALLQAKDFVGEEPWLHLVGDHLYLSHVDTCCAKQLIDVATAHNCPVSAVQRTRENRLPYFGAVGANHVAGNASLYEVTRVIEKPTPTQAEQELVVAGLRSGHYLCFFGMHVLPAGAMEVLEALVRDASEQRKVILSDVVNLLAERERYLAAEVAGTRHNLGVKYGLLHAQQALALSGKDRDQFLTEMVELLTQVQPSNDQRGNDQRVNDE